MFFSYSALIICIPRHYTGVLRQLHTRYWVQTLKITTAVPQTVLVQNPYCDVVILWICKSGWEFVSTIQVVYVICVVFQTHITSHKHILGTKLQKLRVLDTQTCPYTKTQPQCCFTYLQIGLTFFRPTTRVRYMVSYALKLRHTYVTNSIAQFQ